MNIKDSKIGIIGAGNIGQALTLKLIDEGIKKENILLSYNGSIFTFSDLYDNNLVDNIVDNREIVDNCDIIILSVPPQKFKQIGEFNLDADVPVISFMAGISIEDICTQTGSENVVKVIPTGPDTIKNSTAIAGVYPRNDLADELFTILGFDVYNVAEEDDLKYMSIAGCLPAVFCKVDINENMGDIKRFSENFSDFVEISKKASKLVPSDNRDEFIKSFATPGGITEAIINALDENKNLYEALNIGLKREGELS